MNNLVSFLTSKEIIFVYIIAGLACLLCFIIYIVEKNTVKRRQRHNTRELNKLVEEVQEEVLTPEEPVMYEEPVLQVIEEEPSVSSVVELLDNTEQIREKQVLNAPVVSQVREEVVEPLTVDYSNVALPKVEKPVTVETAKAVVAEVREEVKVEPVIEETEELEYTSAEPDQVTAQLELKKLTEELRKQEEMEEAGIVQLTDYEEQQEENAIISLQELVDKSKELYAANELSQYADEGNEPISLQELEKNNNVSYDEPFIIENVVDTTDEEIVMEEVETPMMKLDDMNTISINTQVEPEVKTSKKFQNSPFISPIYGIEGSDNSTSSLELENTANYDKLDAEIKKTNEFLMTLKELQKKLD